MPDKSKKQHTRSVGAYPRSHRPRPLSTRPPSVQGLAPRNTHEVYVQIANLQMAKARQERIQAALQDQVNRCMSEIQHIDRRVQELFRQVGITGATDEDLPAHSDEQGFEFKY